MGIRPTRFEPLPVGALVGQSKWQVNRRFILLAGRLDELCLLFRFEGVGPIGLSTLGARHGAHAPAAHGVPGSMKHRTCGPRPLPFENCRASTSIFVLPSYKEPTVDALAPRTDEGRE